MVEVQKYLPQINARYLKNTSFLHSFLNLQKITDLLLRFEVKGTSILPKTILV